MRHVRTSTTFGAQLNRGWIWVTLLIIFSLWWWWMIENAPPMRHALNGTFPRDHADDLFAITFFLVWLPYTLVVVAVAVSRWCAILFQGAGYGGSWGLTHQLALSAARQTVKDCRWRRPFSDIDPTYAEAEQRLADLQASWTLIRNHVGEGRPWTFDDEDTQRKHDEAVAKWKTAVYELLDDG